MSGAEWLFPYLDSRKLQDRQESSYVVPLLLLQKPKQQRHALVVVQEEVFDLPIGVPQRAVVRGEPHDSVEERLVPERDTRQDQPEEVVQVRNHTIVVVRDIFAEVAEVELDVWRKSRAVRVTGGASPGDVGELYGCRCKTGPGPCRH